MLIEESPGESQAHVKIRSNGRIWIGIGAAFGLVAVVAGAAGTHVLRASLDPGSLSTFETGVRFQMYHALALLAVGVIAGLWRSPFVGIAGWLITTGVVIFCGSLYILATTDLRMFGAVAPIGGLCLMMGWASLILGAIRRNSD